MTRTIIAAVAGLALLVPAGAAAKGRPPSDKGQAKPQTFLFKGTVASVDAAASDVTVTVRRGNRAARRFVGQAVTFDVAAAKLVVADVDGDGEAGAGDVRAGDAVVVQVRAPRSATAAAPLSARKLVDLTSPPVDEDEDEAEDAPSAS